MLSDLLEPKQNNIENKKNPVVSESTERAVDGSATPDLQKIAQAYDSPTWWYDIRGFFILTFAYNSTVWHQIAFFASHMGQKHLELACGTGTLLHLTLLWRRILRKPEVAITGVDYAPSMLAGARKRFKNYKNITLLHGDAGNLMFDDNTFDTVSIANSVHCFPDVDLGLRETYRVLKSGGTFVTNVLLYPDTCRFFGKIAARINKWGMAKGILFTPYTPDDVRNRIEAAGFKILHATRSGNCYDIVATK